MLSLMKIGQVWYMLNHVQNSALKKEMKNTNSKSKNRKFRKIISQELKGILTRTKQLFVRLDIFCPHKK